MKAITKKIWVFVVLCSTIILAWCGKSGQDMSFQDAYSTLKSHNIFADKVYNTPDITKVLRDETIIDFMLNAQEWFSATWVLVSKWLYNLPADGVDMNMWIDAVAFEPSFGTNIVLSWELQFVENSGKVYGSINHFNVSPEKESGNVEWGVVNALVNTISKKWILLTETWDNASLVPYRANIVEFFHQLNKWRWEFSLFKEIGKTSIDWYTAYKIWRDEDWIKAFAQHILQDAKNIGTPVTFDWATMDEVIQGIVSSPLEWYMIIKAKDHIVLRIDSISTQDSWKLGFVYDKNGIELTVKDNNNAIIATGNVEKQKKELAFWLHIPWNNISIEGQTIDNQWKAKVILTNSQFVLTMMIHGTTSTSDAFTAVQIQESTPLSQIIEWFSLIWQGMMQNSQ